MKRRDFIALGGAAAAWPLAARAQQPAKVPTIGFLGAGTPSADTLWTAAFAHRLRELGWIEGRTIAIESRWAENRSDRYAEIAVEFVQLKVAVIVTYATAPVIAAKKATSVIPIVFALSGDPVGSGLVASLARPGANVTGLSLQTTDIAAKRIELLRAVVPTLHRLAILGNPDNPFSLAEMPEVLATARTLGLEATTLEIRRKEDIVPAVEALKGGADALYVAGDPLINANRVRINILAVGARLPTIFIQRENVADVLWAKLPGPFPARRRVCRQDSARGEACRHTSGAADQIRPGRQPGHRQGAWHRRSADTACPRRRGD